MNIFLSFLQSSRQHAIPAYSFWEYYIKNGIGEANFNWLEAPVDWAEGLVHFQDQTELMNWKSKTWQITLEEIKKQHKIKSISFFLSYLYPHQIDEQAIKQIQSMGIPCVNFFCDNVREFKKIPKEFSVFDLNWVPEFKAIEMYRASKYSFINLPMPMWVDAEHRNILTNETEEISFIGSKDIQRVMLFNEVAAHQQELKIYGAGWAADSPQQSNKQSSRNYHGILRNQINFIIRYGISGYLEKMTQRTVVTPMSESLKSKLYGKVQFEDYLRISKQSLVTLGVNRYPSFNHPLKKPNTYSRLRDIEAPMLGACYLTEYTEGLDLLYDLGTEIEVYSNAEEMLEKIDELKNNFAKRKFLRINGQKRALNEHNIGNSLRKIADHLHIR